MNDGENRVSPWFKVSQYLSSPVDPEMEGGRSVVSNLERNGRDLARDSGQDDHPSVVPCPTISLGEGYGRPSKRERLSTISGRAHLMKHKWVLVENFVNSQWIDNVLAIEDDVRSNQPERVETLKFQGTRGESHREMIELKVYPDDKHDALMQGVDRRLGRLKFRSAPKGERVSHARFKPTLLVSTGTANRPTPEQPIHTDFDIEDDMPPDGGYDEPLPFPFSVLIALEDGTRLVDGDTLKEITIPRGSAIIFHGGFAHAGAEYSERNVRLHVYYPLAGESMPVDEHGNLEVYIDKELTKKRREFKARGAHGAPA